MDLQLFRKITQGYSSENRIPTTGVLKNELNRTSTHVGYFRLSPIQGQYLCFIDMRGVQAYDGAILISWELFLNDQYYLSGTFNNPPGDVVMWCPVDQGINNFKFRVKDSTGTYSEFSNTITYDIREEIYPTQVSLGVDYIPDIPTTQTQLEGMFRIVEWYKGLNVNNSGDSDCKFYIRLNNIQNPPLQTTAKVIITLYENYVTPITRVFEVGLNPDPTIEFNIDLNNTNPDGKNLWRTTGFIGVKMVKVDCNPDTKFLTGLVFHNNSGSQTQNVITF